MNILNKVTLLSLRKNKTRTLVTIIGVILSVAMICAVTTCGNSLLDFLLRDAVYYSGSWHVKAEAITDKQLDELLASDKVEKIDYASVLGYAFATDSLNDARPYYYLIEADESTADTMSIHLLEGSYPQNGSELIVSEALTYYSGIELDIGDTISLDVGTRLVDGKPAYQNVPYKNIYPGIYVEELYDDDEYNTSEDTYYQEDVTSPNDELYEEEQVSEEYVWGFSQDYTIVGIFEEVNIESYNSPGYTVITAPSQAVGAQDVYDAYITLKDPSEAYEFLNGRGFGMKPNTEVLAFMGISRHDNFLLMFYGTLAIIIGLIILGSVSLIYNAFSISVSERIKQFGMLSSVGATKKQIRRCVLFEAFIISLISIPIGVLFGIGGIWLTLHLLESAILSITNAISYVDMRLCVSPASVIIAVVISVLTIFVSVLVPSRRATKVTAIEAIKQSRDIKPKGTKVSKLTYKLFGLAGVLASKHYKRNRRKYRSTVIGLFISIVLFVSANFFCTLLTSSITDLTLDYNCDIIYYDYSFDLGEERSTELYEKLSKIQSIDEIAMSYSYTTYSKIDKSLLSDDFLAYIDSLDDYYDYYDYVDVPIEIIFVNDSEYEKLLRDEGLDVHEYMDYSSPKAVVYDNFFEYRYDEDKYYSINIFDSSEPEASTEYMTRVEGIEYYPATYDSYYTEDGELYYTIYDIYDTSISYDVPKELLFKTVELKGGTVLDDAPYFIENQLSVASYIYPISLMDAVIESPGYVFINYYINAENSDTANLDILRLLNDEGFPTDSIINYGSTGTEARAVILITEVFAYGFILLISLIATANVFNTISTNISLRRREFAMLKSVGMTSKDFKKMMCYECILYGIKSLILGIPVAIIVCLFMHKSMAFGYLSEFVFPLNAVLLASFSVFAVVFTTMMYSMHKLKKDNAIDALKDENI